MEMINLCIWSEELLTAYELSTLLLCYGGSYLVCMHLHIHGLGAKD